VTLDEWVRGHPFLQPVALVSGRVDAAILAAAIPRAPIPDWDDYRAEFLAGVPLLHSAGAAIDLSAVEGAIVTVIGDLARRALDSRLDDDLRALAAEVSGPSPAGAPYRIVDWLLGDEGWTPSRPGPLRYVGWRALSTALRPVINDFAAWRDDDRWLRRYCPVCGSLPAMAHLVGTDPGRRRFLSCGCCDTRWRYGRTACPFCEAKSDRLASLAIDGEAGLRIDYCESCRGFLKTYGGQGDEAILLADWTSLHLDLAARDRGLQRLAASLYEIDEASAPS
jgi:FdhE protein